MRIWSRQRKQIGPSCTIMIEFLHQQLLKVSRTDDDHLHLQDQCWRRTALARPTDQNRWTTRCSSWASWLLMASPSSCPTSTSSSRTCRPLTASSPSGNSTTKWVSLLCQPLIHCRVGFHSSISLFLIFIYNQSNTFRRYIFINLVE